MCSQYEIPPFPTPSTYVPQRNTGHSAFESLVYFLALCFAGQLTGGHCNPAITTSLLISKGNKITLIASIVYIFAQFLGAIVGGAIGIHMLIVSLWSRINL